MNNFKQITIHFTAFSLTVLPLVVLSAPNEGGLNPLGGTKTLMELVGKFLKVLIAIGIPISALFIVYSGFLFVTAEGKESDVTKAKEALKWTAAGIAVLIGAQAIVMT